MIIVTLIFFILNIFCLRIFAKEEMFPNGIMLILCIVLSLTPVINVILFLILIVCIIMYKLEDIDLDIDNFAKKIFFVKDKKDDDNFKGKGYR